MLPRYCSFTSVVIKSLVMESPLVIARQELDGSSCVRFLFLDSIVYLSS